MCSGVIYDAAGDERMTTLNNQHVLLELYERGIPQPLDRRTDHRRWGESSIRNPPRSETV